ncbi:cytochrome P450 49a1-like 2 [Homarus americanus]|uniref:Cytochrome P450 49a1-like 2 n=1 Tax=Homarus americanus TaxID=6706 RepID=A0A8J5K2M2_HOMAM|nr:cytochrome P450 49a1-like 2 [Homarus americanus]
MWEWQGWWKQECQGYVSAGVSARVMWSARAYYQPAERHPHNTKYPPSTYLGDPAHSPYVAAPGANSSYATPYLEAYNLMEENADVIFESEVMMSERMYNSEAIPSDVHQPRPASQLPGPRSWPMVGCLPYMLTHKAFDPQRVYLFWEAVRQEFGPIFRKDMPGHPYLVFITQPEDLETLMRSTMYNPLRPGMASLKRIRSDGGADGDDHVHDHFFQGKAGILAEQGQEWWRVRRCVQRPVTNPQIVHRYLPQMDDVAKQFVDRIRRMRDDNDEVPESFNSELYKWALESLGTIALDRRLGCLEEDVSPSSRPMRLIQLAKQLLGALHETENVKLWQYFPTASIRRLQEAHQVFTDVALGAIRDTERLLACRPIRGHTLSNTHAHPFASSCPFHQNLQPSEIASSGTEAPSLLETLLATPGLSREDVLTFLIDMIATGIDTTSHAVGNMLYLLARNPRAQREVQREIDQVVGSPDRLTPDHLSGLTYTKAVFRETLRMMPVNVGIVRRLNRDTVLGGYLVPKGWEVVAPTMLMNHQESVFPRAHEFLPERFLRGSHLAPRHNFAFLPFSYGPRMCIGRRIAYQEIFSLIVRVLSVMEVDYKYEDVHLVNKLSYGPSSSLRFTFTDRR